MEAYQKYYEENISAHFNNEQKLALAKRISALTLEAPIWMIKKDYTEEFPELKPYISAPLSGLYLCTILDCLMKDITDGQHITLADKMLDENHEVHKIIYKDKKSNIYS